MYFENPWLIEIMILLTEEFILSFSIHFNSSLWHYIMQNFPNVLKQMSSVTWETFGNILTCFNDQIIKIIQVIVVSSNFYLLNVL